MELGILLVLIPLLSTGQAAISTASYPYMAKRPTTASFATALTSVTVPGGYVLNKPENESYIRSIWLAHFAHTH